MIIWTNHKMMMMVDNVEEMRERASERKIYIINLLFLLNNILFKLRCLLHNFCLIYIKTKNKTFFFEKIVFYVIDWNSFSFSPE